LLAVRPCGAPRRPDGSGDASSGASGEVVPDVSIAVVGATVEAGLASAGDAPVGVTVVAGGAVVGRREG